MLGEAEMLTKPARRPVVLTYKRFTDQSSTFKYRLFADVRPLRVNCPGRTFLLLIAEQLDARPQQSPYALKFARVVGVMSCKRSVQAWF